MLIRFFLRYPILALLMHIGLGFLVKSQPMVVSVFYGVVTLFAVLEVVSVRDRANLAAYYGLYLASMEILSRMSGVPLFWEFGKYACIAVLGLGSLLGTRTARPSYLFLAYFLLLLPGILVTAAYAGIGEARILDLVSQYLSGPAALFVAGWYFHRRTFQKSEIAMLLRVGLLPSAAVITFLFLGKSLSEIDFIGGSNFDASGGFGPNQVSSSLGWAIVLAILGLLLGLSPTGYRWVDWVLIGFLVFRGLLTFSRGGMMGAFGALGISMFLLFWLSAKYRKWILARLHKIALSLVIIVAIAFIANDLTGNFLLYRYQGISTSEVILGRSVSQSEYLSGREEIIESELEAFSESPVLGIGMGRGTIFREADSRSQHTASHTEFTRMLGEHGMLGLLAMLCLFVFLPLRHFSQLRNDESRQWMLTFMILALFTLAHSGMRMAIPSVAFGLAFLLILPEKRD